jgi:molecular chaperone IbpA
MTNSTLINNFMNRSIGWDYVMEELDKLHSNKSSNFPPYNIVSTDGGTEIQLALAGYSKEDISVTFQDRILTISSRGVDKEDDVKYNYRGVAKRAFTTKFTLGQYHEVLDVAMRDGMLYVTIMEVIPEERQLKTFTIN